MNRVRASFSLLLTTLVSSSALAAPPDSDLIFKAFQQPCRIIDTRLGGGILTGGAPRGFKVAGTDGFDLQGGTVGGCGVPEEASAALINFVAVNPAGAGNLRASAYPNPIPPTGSIINYQALTPSLNIANGLPFPICDHSLSSCSADIQVVPNGANVHLVADVLGYFLRNHQHDGSDIISGIVAEPYIDSTVARDTEIMPAVLANDGTGSGLDADWLDGYDSTSFSMASHDHDTVYEKKYQRTVVVRPAPGATAIDNGLALLAALAGITDNSAAKPYLLKIEPGVYDLGTTGLTMKQNVDIEGSGLQVTKITRAGFTTGNQGTIIGASNSELRMVTVENTGGAALSVAMKISSTSPRIRAARFIASAGSTLNYAIDVSGATAAPDIADCIFTASGGSFSVGIIISNGTTTAINVSGSSSGASAINYGIVLNNSGATIMNSRFSATGGSESRAIYVNGASSQLILKGVVATVSDATAASTGIWIDEASGVNIEGAKVRASGGGPPAACYGVMSNAVNAPSQAALTHFSIDLSTCAGFSVGVDLASGGASNTVTVNQSRVVASSNTILTQGTLSSAKVGGTQLSGGPVFVGFGTIVCAGVYDEAYSFFPDTCP